MTSELRDLDPAAVGVRDSNRAFGASPALPIDPPEHGERDIAVNLTPGEFGRFVRRFQIDPGEVISSAESIEFLDVGHSLGGSEVGEAPRVDDDGTAAPRPRAPDDIREQLNPTARVNLDLAPVGGGHGECLAETTHAFGLVGPEAREEPAGLVGVRGVDRVWVNPDAMHDLRGRGVDELLDGGASDETVEFGSSAGQAPFASGGVVVSVGVTVEVEVETGAGSDVDKSERPSGPVVDRTKCGEDQRRPPNVVRLGGARADDDPQRVGV